MAQPRFLSQIAAVLGAVGSLAFVLWFGINAPLFLLVLFLIWVASPFAAVLFASIRFKTMPARVRSVLNAFTLLMAPLSVLLYAYYAVWPRPSTPAAPFMIIPAVSWLLGTIAVAVAALTNRRGQ